MFLIFMFVIKHNGRAVRSATTARLRSKRRRASRCKTWHNPQDKRSACRHGVLIESSDKVVRLSEARYAYETRLWELEQQFEVKAAKVCEEYLAALLEIHASEANGNQHAHHS
jgi:hypothetical protein